ncbi:DUF4450 domain-containing protein [Hymenobacter persicinus]|uniref:DUF4450 domain-containing protein n=1 Tax=Hymenobacter persicinus TaxID=2025506 RepID=A0A4V1ZAK8_9BACT|nr:DUF4450 domain-containing protein [Hymenobacter persicinus]RYU78560.1 DUF4450 domain-containing protein [Hymenobacter persicinus]
MRRSVVDVLGKVVAAVGLRRAATLAGRALLAGTLLASGPLLAQPGPAPEPLWHNQARTLRYHPEGSDFVIHNGTHRFTRALYGTNTAFRVEAGDLPEFALYLPGMGGNLKLGLLLDGQSKWLTRAARIEARYRPGAMLYTIQDPLLGSAGKLHLEVLALAAAEGVIVKARFENVPAGTGRLLWAFGGATGKKFSRDGDIGADPESSFDLKPEYCQGNVVKLSSNAFTLEYGLPAKAKPGEAVPKAERKTLAGLGPAGAELRVADAGQQLSPQQLWESKAGAAPVLVGSVPVKAGQDLYLLVQKSETGSVRRYAELPGLFAQAEAARQALAGRVRVSTPDAYLNTLGGALSVAADAIWEAPSYLHGAVAWRMRLNGWRGPYAADPLGWHDRAQTHFRAYAQSQLTEPATGAVVMDTARNLARSQEKLGTSVYSRGYVSRNPGGDFRPHHYDMNLVYIDELLRHLRWTGDLAFAREMWPVLERHLAWEKRNFDPDHDGLYDAYAAIWASDALQYSGGGVTHSSAYNYFANQRAAELAALLGLDAAPYRQEAAHIRQALNARLWLPGQGWYAEFQDALGAKNLHPAAGLWTIYHALDSEVADPFQAYQALRYVDTQLPHIPVQAAGLRENGLYLLSTTNWQPYDWSINNVALAENLHASLAYWQAGRGEDAFVLWKSALIESMYLGSSPGNFQQISFYDAHRGELYRDFADPIGVAARSLVEGLFGIRPDALHDTLLVRPGLPAAWDSAALVVPDVTFRFRRQGQREVYTLAPRLARPLALRLQLPALGEKVSSLTVNGRAAAWRNLPTAVGRPIVELSCAPAARYEVVIEWAGAQPDPAPPAVAKAGEAAFPFAHAHVWPDSLADPQHIVTRAWRADGLRVELAAEAGPHTAFARVQQGDLRWWQPLRADVPAAVREAAETPAAKHWETQDLTRYFNDQVTNIFQKNKYLAPRPVGPTLQLPTQGIGNWCYPLTEAVIDDAGLRRSAGARNEIRLPSGVPLRTPGAAGVPNVLFVSQWNNYPREATVPLKGRAAQLQLLLAGSTNPMQSQLDNGEVVVRYTDGTVARLPLRNPDSWWPIEQDYLDDGFAFRTGAPHPLRVHLKTGRMVPGGEFDQYTSIKGFSTRAIDGGAATVLSLPLDPKKKLRSLTIRALANDVVIGLLSATLGRQ